MLALVSLPDFDPAQPGEASDETRFNRATLGLYEMGSTFKIFNTAIALDSGTATLADGFDATKPIRIGRYMHQRLQRQAPLADHPGDLHLLVQHRLGEDGRSVRRRDRSRRT